jgi:hypothetical protein
MPLCPGAHAAGWQLTPAQEEARRPRSTGTAMRERGPAPGPEPLEQGFGGVDIVPAALLDPQERSRYRRTGVRRVEAVLGEEPPISPPRKASLTPA